MPDGFEHIDGMALEPVALAYDATVKTGGRALDLTSTLTVTASTMDEANTWAITNKVNTPRGVTTDSLVARRSSLLPLSRRRSGGSALDISYAGPSGQNPGAGKVAVSGTAGGEPIDVEVEGPVLAGGVHDVIALGTMPLEKGFQAELRIFSPQDQSTKRAKFEVAGTETVETPAGTFETYVVDLKVGEEYATGTVHLRKAAPHYYVKWNTQVSAGGQTRTVRQTLTSIDSPAPSGGQ